MTFIQNINYRNALRYYREVLKSERDDIDISGIFGIFKSLTSFGVREMPQVYEFWCLITIIRVLEENFNFKHSSTDFLALLKVLNPNKNSIEDYSKIDFYNSLAGRRVTLHYQKRLEGNKRPDIILEVTCNKQKINLVLDSKFKNYKYKNSIYHETMRMFTKYGAERSYVFIMHPCGGVNSEILSKYTNFGGQKIQFRDNGEYRIEFPFHKYGYIVLKPNYTDDLKKLIAMSFEYLLESSKFTENRDPKPENRVFCINCTNDKLQIGEGKYKSGGVFYRYSCINGDNLQQNYCGHELYVSYCWNCNTKLFKHGIYWDYHLESTWSTYDIHCPNCGLTMADRS